MDEKEPKKEEPKKPAISLPKEYPFTREMFEKLKALPSKFPDLPDPADDDL